MRLLADVDSPRAPIGRSLGLRGGLRAGWDRYVEAVEESRWLGEVSLDGQAAFPKGRSASLRLSLFRQSYPDSTHRDFRRERADLSFRWPLSAAWRGGCQIDLHRQDYRQTPFHDETGWGLRLSASRALGTGWRGDVSFRLGSDAFGRKSLKLRHEGGETVYVLGPDQKDSIRSVGFTLQRRGPFIMSLGYALSSRRSNSFGFSDRRHDVTFLVSMALPWDMDLQGLASMQLTRYTDSGIDSVFVLRAGEDVEGRDTNNSLTLRLRRPLWSGPTLELRTAWYRNEALLVDRFYSKWIVGFAVRWGLGSRGA